MHARKSHTGFTLVEIIIVAPIVLLTIGIFVGILISITGEVLVARSSNKVAHDTQAALDTIEQDIRLSGSFLTANNLAVASPQGYNNTSTSFNNTLVSQPKSLIINSVATTGGSHQPSRSPVWLRDAPNPCSGDARVQNQVMTYNVVYFIDAQKNLWRRVIMPSNYATRGCNIPDQYPSCALGRTEAICATEDSRILSDVESFSIQYYASAQNTTTPLAMGSIGNATTAHIAITTRKVVAGEDVVYSGTLRATRIGSLMNYATPVP